MCRHCPGGDVVIRTGSGSLVALCHRSTAQQHRDAGRAVILWESAEETLRAIDTVERVYPGATVISEQRAAQETAAQELELALSDPAARAVYVARHGRQPSRASAAPVQRASGRVPVPPVRSAPARAAKRW